jgi:hypothetical protein
MPVGIEAWITQIPPITRGWLALSVFASLAVVRNSDTSSERYPILIRFVHAAMPSGHNPPVVLQSEKCFRQFPGTNDLH